MLSGLWAAQRDDYPVTVKSGHSLSQLVLSPEPIDDTSVARPDALVVLSEDGARKAAGTLARLRPADRVLTVPAFAGLATPARLEIVDPAPAPPRLVKSQLALLVVAAAARRLGLLPREALEAAAGDGDEARSAAALEAIAAGWAL